MDTKKLAPLPTNVTEGQKRRTLRGLAGRLDHIETMESGRAFALVDLRNEVRALVKRIEAIESQAAMSVPPLASLTPAEIVESVSSGSADA